MPEYLSKRFGGKRLRVFMAVLSLLLYIFTKVSVNLYSGGLFIQQSLGWNIYLSMIGLIMITALLTVTGGLAAVIYTDTLQAVLMISGATALSVLNEVACVDPEVCYAICQSSTGCSNIAFPRLVLGVMPTGARGLMMAVMIAALMSDLDSIFNSSSTIFTIDIWKRVIRPKCSVREMMLVGRLWVLVMVGLSIAWVPVMLLLQDGQLFLTIQEISGYLSPPIAAIFLLGVFWKRCNEKGAFWGLMAGFVVGIVRMIIVFSFQSQAGNCLVPDTRPQWYHDFITKINFMYYAIIIFFTTIIVAVVVSLCTKKPPSRLLKRSTWWSRFLSEPRTDNLEEEIAMKPLDEKAELEANQEKKTLCKQGYDWFCGYSATQQPEEEGNNCEKLRKITSIEQDKRAKRLLQVLLVLVISAGVYIFGYFGAPQ